MSPIRSSSIVPNSRHLTYPWDRGDIVPFRQPSPDTSARLMRAPSGSYSINTMTLGQISRRAAEWPMLLDTHTLQYVVERFPRSRRVRNTRRMCQGPMMHLFTQCGVLA